MCARSLDSGPGCLDLRLGNDIALHRVIKLLLRHCLLLRERRVFVHIELGPDLVGLRLRELRLRLQKLTVGLRHLRLCLRNLRGGLLKLTLELRDLAVGLIQRGLKRSGIDLKQQLPLLYERAFLVILSK